MSEAFFIGFMPMSLFGLSGDIRSEVESCLGDPGGVFASALANKLIV